MSSSNRIRVLGVDDHPMVRDGMALAIQQQQDMELIGEAANARKRCRRFVSVNPT